MHGGPEIPGRDLNLFLMSGINWLKEGLENYFPYIHLSRRSQTVLVVIAGVSLSVLVAGYLLRQRRRRYRPVAPKTTSSRSGLHRSSTFQDEECSYTRRANEEYMLAASSLSPRTEITLSEKTSTSLAEGLSITAQITDWQRSGHIENEATDFDHCSVSSEDSFHSTVEALEDTQLEVQPSSLSPHALYLTGLELVTSQAGSIRCRTMRTKMLCCESDEDFLAKVYCLRLAFDFLIQSSDHRSNFMSLSRNILSDFLRGAGEDPSNFCECFNDIASFMEIPKNQLIAEEELTKRNVGAMNVYDIALDFILLDAFDDLECPPSAFVSVMKNTWITDGMKKSALAAALWSILKAKKSMLHHKNGFMSRFYALSEIITPTLAWGFLGTDTHLNKRCAEFKSVVLNFVQSIFSLDRVRYSSVELMSEDILKLAFDTTQAMHHFNNNITAE